MALVHHNAAIVFGSVAFAADLVARGTVPTAGRETLAYIPPFEPLHNLIDPLLVVRIDARQH